MVLLCALFTGVVEFCQFAVIAGRDASLSDLLTNTTGGATGAVLGGRLGLLFLPTPLQAKRLAVAATIGWLAALIATAVLLAPWLPAPPLTGMWGKDFQNRPAFHGRVLSASLAGVPLHDGPLPDADAVRQGLNRGDLELEAEILSGGCPVRWSPIVAVGSGDDIVLGFNQVCRDVVFEFPTRSAQLLLRKPAVVVRDVVSTSDQTPVGLAAGAKGHTIWIRAGAPGVSRRAHATLRPSLGWTLVLPFDYAYDGRTELLTMLWLAGLALPIGYWSRVAARDSARWGLLPPIATVLGTALVPLLMRYPPVPLSEWLAAAGGSALGWVLPSTAAYLASRCGFPSSDGSSWF